MGLAGFRTGLGLLSVGWVGDQVQGHLGGSRTRLGRAGGKNG